MKTLLTLLIFVTLYTTAGVAQITFTTDHHKTLMKDVTDIDYLSTNDFGFKIAINSTLRKYDKIVVNVVYKENDGGYNRHPRSRNYYWLPTSKAFKDKFSGKKYIPVYIFTPKDDQASHDDLVVLKKDRMNFENLTYKVTVEGYFQNGTKTEWTDESYKTVPVYEYSKTVFESVEFTFARDEVAFKEAEEKRLEAEEKERIKAERRISFARYSEIESSYTITYALGYIAPGMLIFKKYEILRDELIEQKDFTNLEKVELKLIALKDKKVKELRLSLKEVEDTKEIMKLILDFQPQP
ncbi:MAG: hypothetical protein GQ574_29050 [Crocinitomix sp.]|nr:hypothetical protein [Crocinitomix sp.]